MVYLALFAGVLFAILLYFYLTIHMGGIEKKYKALEAQIKTPILYKTDANLHSEKKVSAVRLYFCADRLIILCAEQNPKTKRSILYSNISSWDMTSPYRTIISINTGEEIDLQVAIAELIPILRDKVRLDI